MTERSINSIHASGHPPAGRQRVAGKVALVFGAGSSGPGWGNGKAAAVVYAREGARVAAVDIDRAAAEATRDVIRAEGFDCEAYVADVTVSEQVAAVVAQVQARFGTVDILHNNVGIEAFGDLLELTEASWDRVHEVNLRGAMLAARAVMPHMIRQGGGSIINMSSIASRKWSPMQFLSYSTSKAALNHMTRVASPASPSRR